MSRDKRGNRTQEVIGSIPFSSTNEVNDLADPSRSAFLSGDTMGDIVTVDNVAVA